MFKLLAAAFFIFLFLVLAWGFGEYMLQTTHSADSQVFVTTIETLSAKAWEFGRPLLQLLIVLILLQWFMQRWELKMPALTGLAWDARTVVALLIVITFCLSALAGFMMEGLKEALLVVLGFYFGSLQRTQRSTTDATSTTTSQPQAP